MRTLALCLLLAACKPAVDPTGPAASPFEEDDPQAQGPEAEAPAAAPVARDLPTAPGRRSGEVDRAALLAELDRSGPARFLQGVNLEATFEAERFIGWRIVDFRPIDPRLAAIDLRPGDVVTGVNQRPIARPEEWYAIWTALRTADAIRVSASRGGQPFELVFRVVGAPPPAGGRS